MYASCSDLRCHLYNEVELALCQSLNLNPIEGLINPDYFPDGEIIVRINKCKFIHWIDKVQKSDERNI